VERCYLKSGANGIHARQRRRAPGARPISERTSDTPGITWHAIGVGHLRQTREAIGATARSWICNARAAIVEGSDRYAGASRWRSC
jgi:hypothetical protein